MLAADVEFLIRRIAGKLDDLHAVQQRRRDGLQRIGRRDEEHIGKIVRQVEIVVGEGIVLLRVQNLQQGGRRVAVVAGPQLVDLVQDHHGIHDAGLFDARKDAPRHSADIGAAVAADFGFVADAAEAQADVFAPEHLRDAFPEARFPRPGRADQQQDGPLLVLLELHHGDVLQDALFHFFQPVMLLVEQTAGFLQADGLGLADLPRQRDQKIKVVADDAVIRACGILLFELLDFFQRRFADFIRHMCVLNPGTVIFGCAAVSFAELLLNRVELFPEDGFSIIPARLFGEPLGKLDLKLDGFLVAHEIVDEREAAGFQRRRLHQGILLLARERDELADGTDQNV